MPFFEEPIPPATPNRAPYQQDVVRKWTAEIARADGFVFVTPEYNHGPSAILKNAIDRVYPEWNRKAVAFVSNGGAAGVRSVQQLHEIAIEVQLAPIRSSVNLPAVLLRAHFQGDNVDRGLAEFDGSAGTMIDDLLWWTAALRAARSLTS
jgi:NAD(P)H-dependent FMN reductase